MNNYTECRLGNICSRLSSGKGITAEDIFDEGEYPVYGGNGLRGYTASKNFTGACAIIGRQGAYCGNVKYFEGEAYMTEHAVVVVAKPEHNTRYLSFVLDGLKLGRLSGQAAQPGLSVKQLAKIRVFMPEKSYQDKIANILSEYDLAIENNNKRIRILEQMGEDLYKEWFVRFRFPGHEDVEFENGIPRGWEYKKLFDVANVKYGYAFNSDEFCDDNKLRAVVRIRDIPNNKTNTYTTETCDEKYHIKDNAILVGMDGIFHMCLWCGGDAFLNQRVVEINGNDISNLFLFHSIYPQVKFWEQTISGTTVAHLGDKHLKKMSVIIPNEIIMKRANAYFNDIMNEISNARKKNVNLIKQRDFLLPRLMSGKLQVN